MSDTTDSLSGPPQPRRRRRIRPLWRAIMGIAILVLAGGAVWFIDEVVHSCGPIRSGVDEVDGQCVGVTDGSYVFHPELARVERLIAEENAEVRANSSSYVTVAVLNLLTPTATSATSAEQIRSQLEGAYTAQRRLNEMGAALLRGD